MNEDSRATFSRVAAIIELRAKAPPESSYVARLMGRGRAKIAQKVGEEAVETVLAAAVDDVPGMIAESADLMFHLMVLWASAGITIDDVAAEIARREGISGLDEKRSRPPE